MRFFYQRLFQPLFTQIAPGANRVEDYIYAHYQEAIQVYDADQYSNGQKFGETGRVPQDNEGLQKRSGFDCLFQALLLLPCYTGRGPRAVFLRKVMIWNA